MAIGDTQHLLAVVVVASRFLPQVGRLYRRHEALVRADTVLLLTHDALDLLHDAKPERQPVVESRARLANHPGAQHQAVRDQGGFRRLFA